ncbi:right-handed parallel beta-helix repeat-containing protein [Micromonospora auratinigra]|uniref:Pectate lyase superfamily protein n=1 Tax=Micromonospora auratinigra TaxID=261654 RepID=A0A1A8ZYL4_9ACTN|nr:right-handed parallel beta-helix repeat-containing protein [Micromonospora auratinigra]SBT49244.1 Pectate lyase superfamily protein [Micromonospora auratinigra]
MQDKRSDRRQLLRAAAVTAGAAVAVPALGGITPAQAAALASTGAIPWVGKAGSGAPYIADETVGAQVAINAALSTDTTQTAVYVAPGTYLVKGPVVLNDKQALIGAGPLTTLLKATSGFSGAAMVTTPAGASTASRQCVTDIGLEAAGLVANGINFQTNADPAQYGPDPGPWLTRVFVSRTTGDGIYLGGTNPGGVREFKLTDCRVENTGGWGYNLQSSDGFVSGCSCQGSDAGGYLLGGGNIKAWGSKVYGTGTSTTAGPGFRLASSRATVVGCEAQDLAGNGFEILGANCTVSGCTADSTGVGSTDTGSNSAGFYVGASAVSVEGGAFQRSGGGAKWIESVGPGMRYALVLAGGVDYVSVRLVSGSGRQVPFVGLISGTAGTHSSISVLG